MTKQQVKENNISLLSQSEYIKELDKLSISFFNDKRLLTNK